MWLASRRSEAQVLVCLPLCGAPWECYYNTVFLLCCDYFSSSSVISRAFSVLCMYSKFRHLPCPLDYLCAKFRFFLGFHCWASSWRKITYSINSLLTRPAYLMAQRAEALPLRSEFKKNRQNVLFHEKNKIQPVMLGWPWPWPHDLDTRPLPRRSIRAYQK